MTTEILNDFTDGLSLKSLGLLGAIILMALCCACKCATPSVRRTKDGKIEVNIEREKPMEAIEDRKKSRKALKSSRYAESDSSSDETMTRSEKKALKKLIK